MELSIYETPPCDGKVDLQLELGFGGERSDWPRSDKGSAATGELA